VNYSPAGEQKLRPAASGQPAPQAAASSFAGRLGSILPLRCGSYHRSAAFLRQYKGGGGNGRHLC